MSKEVRAVEREVYLLQYSRPSEKWWNGEAGGYLEAVRDLVPEESRTQIDYNLVLPDGPQEMAGRACYDAFRRNRPETAVNEDYLANIIRQNHLSVAEHSSFTIFFRNISRAATHELVRHRHFSFSQESQRFVHGRKRDVVIPPAMRDMDEEKLLKAVKKAFDKNERVYDELREAGLKHKEASEAARAYLPNMAATSIVVTGNSRSWKEFIEKRLAPGADRELQEIAQEVLNILEEINPGIFGPGNRSLWDGKEIQNGPKK